MSKLHSHDTFDRAMRDRYREAVQHVSPATRTQLRANRHAATRGEWMPARGWSLGAAFGGVAAVVFAVTFSLNLDQRLDEGVSPDSPATGNMLAVANDMPLVTALDQDPDFYAWLTSSDAQLMTME